jgi:hypothetical protein
MKFKKSMAAASQGNKGQRLVSIAPGRVQTNREDNEIEEDDANPYEVQFFL